jgi:hypothetical protein
MLGHRFILTVDGFAQEGAHHVLSRSYYPSLGGHCYCRKQEQWRRIEGNMRSTNQQAEETSEAIGR